MFGKHFAYENAGSNEEGWTPPWLRREADWQGPRHHEHGHGHHEHGGHRHEERHESFGHGGPFGPGPRFFMRRGPFGPGGPFGHGGPFGPGGPHGPGEGSRFFGRGDIKFALLELLQERPMHGYEMMKALEEKSGGFYTPSAGSIYPTLQMLEDRGFVTVQEVEGKKVYSITDTGRGLLAERHKSDEEFAGPPWMRQRGFGRPRFSPELQALKSEAVEVMRLLTIAGRMSFQDPEQLGRLRGIIERTRKDLSDMIYSPKAQAGQATPTTGGQEGSGTAVEEA
ncbi:MAG: PadR family transcriptional regulator [Ktedonobacteraceae bacterium]